VPVTQLGELSTFLLGGDFLEPEKTSSSSAQSPLSLLALLGIVISFFALRSKRSTSVQKKINSISKESQGQQEAAKPCPPDKRQGIIIEVNFSPEEGKRYYTEQSKTYRLQKWVFLVGVITLVTLVIYTCFTYRQSKASDRQVELLEAIQRPGLGGIGITLHNAPVAFHVRHHPGRDRIELFVDASYHIKNFGIAPAYRVNPTISISLDFNEHIENRPADSQMRCEEQPTSGVIFPNSETVHFLAPTESETSWSHITDIYGIWILGCVSYYDLMRNEFHHTRFWLHSTHSANAQWTKGEDGSFRYLPIEGFESWAEDAD
jgi:hypothetical protein